ncbi:hypothetical protein CVT25_014635 [Psilocybe cyanescens]|uniref:Uncharacterized protein n=1 Tax=Psilocybe cyanescens TaxID=93625 RepID=A0A409WTX6_PSICY|nr:hypothetical protein CVT25_014635 [Psilocybe cyanescens]
MLWLLGTDEWKSIETLASRRARSPARLIIRKGRTDTRYPPWVFGFLLPADELLAAITKVLPPAPERDESPEHEHSDRYDEIFDHLELQAAIQGDAFGWKLANIQISACWVNGRRGLVLSLRKCTRPHRDFLFPDNELEVLKNLMAKDGFTKDATWYRIAVD